MPKLVADALGVFVTVVLLLAAVGLLLAALGTGHAGLAWGSVALSVVAAVMILRRWRRSWLQSQDEPVLLLGGDELVVAEPGGQPLQPVSVAAAQPAEPGSEPAEHTQRQPCDTQPGGSQPGGGEPGEEDTDAADLLVVYELVDEVLVVDEHPRYHLSRCRWPDHARVECLPVREARELGFTPCDRCRPDTTLARKHRATRATATGSS